MGLLCNTAVNPDTDISDLLSDRLQHLNKSIASDENNQQQTP